MNKILNSEKGEKITDGIFKIWHMNYICFKVSLVMKVKNILGIS